MKDDQVTTIRSRLGDLITTILYEDETGALVEHIVISCPNISFKDLLKDY